MPQLIAFALIGIVGWYAYSVFKKEMAKLTEQERKDSVKRPGTKNTAELEQDPKTGVYRPKKMD